jgi:hypothetical protein
VQRADAALAAVGVGDEGERQVAAARLLERARLMGDDDRQGARRLFCQGGGEVGPELGGACGVVRQTGDPDSAQLGPFVDEKVDAAAVEAADDAYGSPYIS